MAALQNVEKKTVNTGYAKNHSIRRMGGGGTSANIVSKTYVLWGKI